MHPLLLRLLSIGILISAPAAQAYEWQISAGQGVQPKSVEQHQLFRVAWRSDLPWSWYESKTGKLSSGIALGMGLWHGDEINTGELFVTPALRYEWAPADNGAQFFIEAGAGGHLFSRTDYAKRGAFSTAFQFGEQLGAGVRFGEKRDQDLTLLYQHHSNADIKTPNYGADFIVLRYGFKM
ncbi:MAG: acyloxyacyl hydrolase [Iodobacter sp.]